MPMGTAEFRIRIWIAKLLLAAAEKLAYLSRKVARLRAGSPRRGCRAGTAKRAPTEGLTSDDSPKLTRFGDSGLKGLDAKLADRR
jgi:hypothetical protein